MPVIRCRLPSVPIQRAKLSSFGKGSQRQFRSTSASCSQFGHWLQLCIRCHSAMELWIILVKYHSILTDFAMPKHADREGTGRDLSRNPLYSRQRIRRHFEKRSNSEPFETPFSASAAAVWGGGDGQAPAPLQCSTASVRPHASSRANCCVLYVKNWI